MRDVVQQRFGLWKASKNSSQESSRLSKKSVSGTDHSLEDASSSKAKTLANTHAGSTHLGPDSPLYRHAQGDDYFKRPLGSAPRVSEISTMSASSSASQSRSAGLGSMSTTTERRTHSHVSSSKKDRSQLTMSSRGPPVGAGSQDVLLTSPSKLHHKVSPIGSKIICSPSSARDSDSKIQLGNQRTRWSSLSSPDLRTFKSEGRELSTFKSVQNLLVPQRDKDTMKESKLLARKKFIGLRGDPTKPSSHISSTAGGTKSPSCSSVPPDSKSWPAPPVLLVPADFVDHSKMNLGTIWTGSRRTVLLALINPTKKNRCYEIRQLYSSIDGHPPKHFETVVAEFPGQNTVAAGCVAEIQGSFLSMSPGAVEITVGLVTENEAGGQMTLVAQVEGPRIVLERSQSHNFEGDSFRALTESTPVNHVADQE